MRGKSRAGTPLRKLQASIVTYQLDEKDELKPGAAVFVDAASHGSTVTANSVAVGTDGVTPPT